MRTQVIMPQLGESVVEGTVAKWLIAKGQPVKQGDPLLQITTDKVDTDLPAPASGILLEIGVAEGDTVAKGTVLALIEEAGEEQESGGRGQPGASPLAQRPAAERSIDLASVHGTGPGGRITKQDVETSLAAQPIPPTDVHRQSPGLGFISPAVARLVEELGVDLTQVTGTGANGRITKKDVMAYIAAPVPREPVRRPLVGGLAGVEEWPASMPGPQPFLEPVEAQEAPAEVDPDVLEDVEAVPLSAMRRSIARHMTDSVRTVPHVTTVMEADMTRVVLARERLQGEFARQGVKLTFSPFFIQAIVAAIKAVPETNSSFREDALLIYKRIHIGVAVAIPDGLIVPVIRDAEEKSLLGLARAVNDLADRARNKQLTPDDVRGGTFTLTNHGASGSLFATPIIVQPQAGILGVGAIQKRPVVIRRGHSFLPDAEDALAIRPMVYLGFTFDHRVLDGHDANRFLAEVKGFLESYSG